MRRLIILVTLLSAWLALAAAAMVPGTIRTAVIPANTTLPDNISIIGKRGPLLVIYSEDPKYVRALYKSGAKFVLPARKKTCLNLQNG